METPTLILKETVQQLRVLLNPEHPLFGMLPYTELLAHLCDPCPRPLHLDQLLLTELAQDFINLRQAVHQERLEIGEYIAPGGHSPWRNLNVPPGRELPAALEPLPTTISVTILFPYRSILLIVHSCRLLTWRGSVHFSNTAYLLVHSPSTFSLVNLFSDVLIF